MRHILILFFLFLIYTYPVKAYPPVWDYIDTGCLSGFTFAVGGCNNATHNLNASAYRVWVGGTSFTVEIVGTLTDGLISAGISDNYVYWFCMNSTQIGRWNADIGSCEMRAPFFTANQSHTYVYNYNLSGGKWRLWVDGILTANSSATTATGDKDTFLFWRNAGQYNFTLSSFKLNSSYSMGDDESFPPIPSLPPTPINLDYTTDNSTYVNWTWQAGSGNITDSFNVSINGSWTNGSANLFYNHTGLTYLSWSNISVFAFNSSGGGTLNTTGISESVQLPAEPPSSVTIVCLVGWCYIAANQSSTLISIQNNTTNTTIQGHYNKITKKYEDHRINYSFNQNISVAQKEGYYVYYTAATNITYTPGGTSPDYLLVTGWNLVGNWGTSSRTLTALKTSIGANATQAQYYNRTTRTWISTGTQSVPAMESFMVYLTSQTEWSG